MKNNKIFIACDSKSQKKINEIIKKTQNSKLKIGYKFGLEFLNSKQGRIFISKLKNKIIPLPIDSRFKSQNGLLIFLIQFYQDQ